MKTMTKILSTAVISSAFLVGCQSITNLIQKDELSYDTLRSNYWQLVDAKDMNGNKLTDLYTQPSSPLMLNFVEAEGQNIMALGNTCNKFSANYDVVGDSIQLSQFATTMKMCPLQQAKFDSAAAKAVMGNYRLSKSEDGTAMLTVTGNSSVAQFKAVPFK